MADQVIVGFDTPGIVTVNCCCWFPINIAVAGDTEIVVTVTAALAVTEVSAALAAVMVWPPVAVGAV